MFAEDLKLRKPGLFVTATDTGVGKTVITCAIAMHLRNAGQKVGVCKPLATGCRRDREGLVSEDAEALAHFSDCRQPLEVITPVRFRPPLAPAVAAEKSKSSVDFGSIRSSLLRLERASQVLLVEGIGGIMVPICRTDRLFTVLDLIQAIGYPALIVARAGLGTLNHTAMTVRLLRDAGCRLAGLVINGYLADAAGRLDARNDLAMATNRQWLETLTGTRVLATVPRCNESEVAAHKGTIPTQILEAVGMTHWPSVIGSPKDRF